MWMLYDRVCVWVCVLTACMDMCRLEEAGPPGIRSRSRLGEKTQIRRQIPRPVELAVDVWLKPHVLCMWRHCKTTHVSKGSHHSRSALQIRFHSTGVPPKWTQLKPGGEISHDTNEAGGKKCCEIHSDSLYWSGGADIQIDFVCRTLHSCPDTRSSSGRQGRLRLVPLHRGRRRFLPRAAFRPDPDESWRGKRRPSPLTP